jgi:hypothetical protein
MWLKILLERKIRKQRKLTLIFNHIVHIAVVAFDSGLSESAMCTFAIENN